MKKVLLGDELLTIFAQIGETAVALDIQGVNSVIEPQKVRKIPAVPGYINSILNHHGNIVTLFDINAYFQGKELAEIADKKVIYLKHKEAHLGIVVDKIFKIDYISPSYQEKIPEGESGNIQSDFCQGVFVSDEAEDNIYLLDAEKILSFTENLELHF